LGPKAGGVAGAWPIDPTLEERARIAPWDADQARRGFRCACRGGHRFLCSGMRRDEGSRRRLRHQGQARHSH